MHGKTDCPMVRRLKPPNALVLLAGGLMGDNYGKLLDTRSQQSSVLLLMLLFFGC